MSIDIPILDGEEWWSSQVIDDTDSVIRSLLELTNSCIELKIKVEDANQLHAELSLHKKYHNIELETDKWLAFCASLRQSEIAVMANEVENKLNSYVSIHLKSRSWDESQCKRNDSYSFERSIQTIFRELCLDKGIKLFRWPYYFQLTKDVARYFFPNHYTNEKYQQAIKIVYGASKESEILAPGLHGSKFTPANFTSLGIKRFINDLSNAPISLRSQVIHSFHLYEKMIEAKNGKDFLWLLYPQDSAHFDEFMKHKPDPKYLNYVSSVRLRVE